MGVEEEIVGVVATVAAAVTVGQGGILVTATAAAAANETIHGLLYANNASDNPLIINPKKLMQQELYCEFQEHLTNSIIAVE